MFLKQILLDETVPDNINSIFAIINRKWDFSIILFFLSIQHRIVYESDYIFHLNTQISYRISFVSFHFFFRWIIGNKECLKTNTQKITKCEFGFHFQIENATHTHLRGSHLRNMRHLFNFTPESRLLLTIGGSVYVSFMIS